MSWSCGENSILFHDVSPTGKPFRVLGGAFGAWSSPNSLTMRLLYGHAFDGVAQIDGYNDLNSIGAKEPLFSVNRFEYDYITGKDLGPARFLGPLAGIPSFFLKYELDHWHLSYWTSVAAANLAHTLGRRANNSGVPAPRDVVYEGYPHADAAASHRWNASRVEEMIRLQIANSEVQRNRFAYFLQPMPALGKELTESERRKVSQRDLAPFRSVFLTTVEKLRREGLPVYSLVDVFRDVKTEIYVDEIHCRIDPGTYASPGYELISRKMAEHLAKAWKLRRAPSL